MNHIRRTASSGDDGHPVAERPDSRTGFGSTGQTASAHLSTSASAILSRNESETSHEALMMSRHDEQSAAASLGNPRRQTDIQKRILAVLLLVWMACRPVVGSDEQAAAPQPFDRVTITDLKRHCGTLASDALEGREAGSTGGHAAAA